MTTCSIVSRDRAEPLSGTAATAPTWLLVEQPGPWGGKALTESQLDPEVGAALERAAHGTGVRIALIRRPGRHPAPAHPAAPRRVYLAHTGPGRSWVRTTALTEVGQLHTLDWAALGAGDHGGLWEPHRGEPLALVCTNGRRDRCCALLGRPLAEELATSEAADVWETTHLGGHRFAPTLLVLPYGYAYGRVSGHRMKTVLEAVREGRVDTGHCRGRSTWDRPGQAADLAVRRLAEEDAADALTVTQTVGESPEWTVTVRHRDGREWHVSLASDTSAPPAPSSCDGAPGTLPRLVVTRIDLARRPAG